MTEKQEALKPCPFCADGGNPELCHHSFSSHPFVVICVGKANGRLCNAQLWPSFTKEEAIASWNTRALTEAPNVDVEVLKRRAPTNPESNLDYLESDSIIYDTGWNNAMDDITTHYHLVKKEKKHD